MEARARPLRIGLLAGDTGSHFCRRFIGVAEKAGHTVIALHINGFEHDPRGEEPLSYYGAPPAEFDVLVPRIGAGRTDDGIEIVRKFEARNLHCLASPAAIAACRNQKAFAARMQAAGILMPRTVIAESGDEPSRLISAIGGPPLVIKLPQTSLGEGVILARTFERAAELITGLQKLRAPFAVQKFIDSRGGSDIRCLVLGGRVVAATGRRAKAGDFRSNLYQGGTVYPVAPGDEARSLSIRAAQQVGLGFAGVDLICLPGKSYVLEVNASPGIRSFESVTQKAIVHDILLYLGRMALSRLGQSV